MTQPGGRGIGRAARDGALTGLVLAVLAGIAIFAYAWSGNQLPGQGRADTDRVLFIMALPDEDGALVAQVIAEVDSAGPAVTVSGVDPDTSAEVPGTGYGLLRDAYAFGGGESVSRGYAAVLGGDPLPFVDLGPEAVQQLLTATRGLELTIPAEMNVFDGDRLYQFAPGPRRVSGEELRALLNGSAYLGKSDREWLLEQVAKAVVSSLGDYPGGLSAAVDARYAFSDLSETALDELVTGVTKVR